MRSTSAWPSRAAGPADDHEHGGRVVELGQRLDGDVEALERLDPADEQQHRPVERAQVGERGAGPGPVAGREERVDDARRHDLDPGRVGAVEPLELGGLGRAVGEDGVRAADRPRASASTRRCGSGSPVSALTRARVWNVDTSGRSSSCLSRWPGDARQPVVGVQGVDAAARRRWSPGGRAPRRRTRRRPRAAPPWAGRPRPRRHVHDPEPGLDVDHVGQVVGPPAGVHVAGHAGLGQGRHQLADVDVHAATVARARLGEGRRVQGEDSESAHQQRGQHRDGAGDSTRRRHGGAVQRPARSG